MKREAHNPFKPKSNPYADLTQTMVEDEPVQQEQSNAIVPASDGTMRYKRFALTANGLSIPANVTQDEWADIGKVINHLDNSMAWVAGDWAAYANKAWGMTYESMAATFGYETQTLRLYASVCREYGDLLTRNQQVSFTHHRAVIGEVMENRIFWLHEAEKYGWTVSQMRDAIAKWREEVSPTPSKSDPRGGLNFAKKAAKVGKNVNRVGEKKMRKDSAELTLRYIQEMRQWLDEAERIAKRSVE